MIEYIIKDITTVKVGIVAHGVNCQGVMGSGVALAIRNRWPMVYDAYKRNPTGKPMLGTIHLINISDDDSLWVANCYTQVFYGHNGKFADPKAVEECLTKLSAYCGPLQLPYIYLPRIGCGLGGLSWEKEVRPIIEKLADNNPDITYYICDIKEDI